MVEILGIAIDRRPKERPRKRRKYIIEKIGCISIFHYKDLTPIESIKFCEVCKWEES